MTSLDWVELLLFPHKCPDVIAQNISTAHSFVTLRGIGIYTSDETPESIAERGKRVEETRILARRIERDGRVPVSIWVIIVWYVSVTLSSQLFTNIDPLEYRTCHYLLKTLHKFNQAPILQALSVIILGIRANTDSYLVARLWKLYSSTG